MRRRARPEVVCDPEIRGGDPTIFGTRVPVTLVMVYLSAGADEDELVRDYPYLPRGTLAAVDAWARATGLIPDTTPEYPWRRFARQ